MKKSNIITLFSALVIGCTMSSCNQQQQRSTTEVLGNEVTITKEVLMDKIKGGWAGQTIGCTYGGPTEFRYPGTLIQNNIPIEWPEHYIKWYYNNFPGLYDDIYMDLTFVEVFERCGLDAPVDSFALAFAHADYPLWHANQAARANILKGIMPPASGDWKHSAHADDIDYQIEADYAGLMSPGMPNSANAISDKIGHIMNYGDGWYGGVYVGTMYSLAFIYDNVETIVSEGLKAIPERSRFYRCIADVIEWHKQYPNDWKQAWAEVEKKYDEDLSCPEGIFQPFNIDAMLNSAYVVIGLLYGQGDFARTIDIATRCGQDSDCNPATAGGILATIIGYSNIPEYWKNNLHEVEDLNFEYTTISLNKTYSMSFKHALQMIERNGGKVNDNEVIIKTQKIEPVRFEQSYPDLYPVKVNKYGKSRGFGPSSGVTIAEIGNIEFNGCGIIICGEVRAEDQDYAAQVEVYLDGNKISTEALAADSKRRNLEVYYNPQIELGHHTLSFKWINPAKGATINVSKSIIFSNKPVINQLAPINQ